LSPSKGWAVRQLKDSPPARLIMADEIKTSKALKYLGCYLFLLPNAAMFVTFILFPVIFSLGLSLFEWKGIEISLTAFRFVGLNNFSGLISNRYFWQYFGNTCFLMMSIPVMIGIHLGVALVMNRGLKEVLAYRTIWFLPSVAAGVAMLLVWAWIYQAKGGLLNNMLAAIGIPGPNWLGSAHWAKPALMTMTWWNSAGGMGMILYLAALQGVPQDYYDAAAIDGAGWWGKFRHITWPMVSPTTFFMLITGVIGGFQAGFTNVYVLTGGGPAGATTTISYYIYNNAYRDYKLGYASAIAWFLFIFVAGATIINWKYLGRRVHYWE